MQSFLKMEEEGTLSNSFVKLKPWYQNQTVQKEKYKLVSLINVDAKILKLLTNKIL